MVRRLKLGLSWIVSGVGILIGAFSLILFAKYPVSHGMDFSEWVFVVTSGLYGLVCIVGSWVALRDRRRGAYLLLWTIPAWLLVLGWATYHVFVLIDGFDLLAAVLIVFLVPTVSGLFWLITHRYGWQPALHAKPGTSVRRFVVTVAIGTALFAVIMGAALFFEMRRSFFDCNRFEYFFAPLGAEQVVFVAETRRASCSKFNDYTKCKWAVAVVREQFWGLRWWERRSVILVGNFKPGGKYLVEGTHFPGLLTRFLPFIMFVPCGQTSRVEDSIELRLLHDRPPKDGVRIIGKVEFFAGRSQGRPGVKVLITDSQKSFVTTTDSQGIYDVSGLPPGRFRVEVAPPNPTQSHCEKENVKAGEAWGCYLSVLPGY